MTVVTIMVVIVYYSIVLCWGQEILHVALILVLFYDKDLKELNVFHYYLIDPPSPSFQPWC